MASNSLSNLLYDVNLERFISDLYNGGWFHIVFPFLLVYAIVFTILNQIELFREKKPVKVIISFVFGIFSVSFPISTTCSYGGSSFVSGCTLGDLMMMLFPKVTALTMGILALYIIAAMLGVDLVDFLGKDAQNGNIIRYILGGISFLVIGYYFGIGMDWWSNDFRNLWLIDLLTDPLLWVIIVFAFFFWYISKDDEPHKRRDEEGTHVHINNKEHH